LVDEPLVVPVSALLPDSEVVAVVPAPLVVPEVAPLSVSVWRRGACERGLWPEGDALELDFAPRVEAAALALALGLGEAEADVVAGGDALAEALADGEGEADAVALGVALVEPAIPALAPGEALVVADAL
jgi:hypothetical protein